MDQALPHPTASPFHPPASGRVSSARAERSGPLLTLPSAATLAPPPLLEGGSGSAESLEDPDSPGRSPRALASAVSSATEELDPLGHSFGVVAGFAIALLTLIVPLGSVVADRPTPARGGAGSANLLPLPGTGPSPRATAAPAP